MSRTNYIKPAHKPSKICGDYGYHRKDGKPCSNWVTPGTHACRAHAGKTLDEHTKTAQETKIATQALNAWGLIPDQWVDPIQTILNLISLSARRVAMYAELLNAIQHRGIAGDVMWRAEGEPGGEEEPHEDMALRIGLTPGQLALYKTVIGNVYEMSKGGELYISREDHRAIITLDGHERDRLSKLCIDAAKLNIEERRITAAQEQGGKLASVVRRMLDELNLSEQQLAAAGPAFRRAMTAMFNEGNILEGSTTE